MMIPVTQRKSIAPTTVARCRPGVVMTGGVFPDWQEKSIDAGPVGIRKRPLRAVQRQPDGTLVTKMPVLIDGQDKVTIAAVAGMKDRVRFFDGAEARSFSEDEGFPRVRFRPCEDRQQTVWPGGIRVKGDGRVRLDYRGRPETLQNRTRVPGRPKRFAQTVGTVVNTAGAVLAIGPGITGAGVTAFAIVVVFSTLESTFAFCFGCTMFAALIRAGLIRTRSVGLRLASHSTAPVRYLHTYTPP